MEGQELNYPSAMDADGFFFHSAADEKAGISKKVFPNGGSCTRNNGVIAYPTVPGTDGYYYENEGEYQMKIETRVDAETEDMTKRVSLSRGRTAIVREITKKEGDKAQRIAGKNEDMLAAAYAAQAGVITDKDGKVIPFVAEQLNDWKAKDTNRLLTACNLLNF